MQVDINATRYLDNMIAIIISQNLKKMNSLREKHERDWYSEPIEVNAFNSYSENAISEYFMIYIVHIFNFYFIDVPMAILTFPMYHLGLEYVCGFIVTLALILCLQSSKLWFNWSNSRS